MYTRGVYNDHEVAVAGVFISVFVLRVSLAKTTTLDRCIHLEFVSRVIVSTKETLKTGTGTLKTLKTLKTKTGTRTQATATSLSLN
jgi:hypothetical protein